MRVQLLVTDYPSSVCSWAGVFHRTLAEALVRRGMNVTVVAPLPRVPLGVAWLNRAWQCYRRIPRRYESGGVLVERPRYFQPPCGRHWHWSYMAFARLAGSVAARQRSDIVHAHFAYPPGLAAQRLSRRSGIPWMLTLHGSDVNAYPHWNTVSHRRFCAVLSEVPQVIAVSHALAGRAFELSQRMPSVLPIGINLRPYRHLPPKSVARERVGLPLRKRIILFVGQLTRAKGVDVLLEAARLNGDAETLYAFLGSGDLRKAIQGDMSCCVLGEQPNERVGLYFAAADAVVLPSLSEGMPTVLVEAGAAGAPVIATQVGGVPELLADQRGYLIRVGDPQALASAIRWVLSDQAEARRRADKLRAYVTEYYDVDRNVSRLAAHYQEAIQMNRMAGVGHRSAGEEAHVAGGLWKAAGFAAASRVGSPKEPASPLARVHSGDN